MSHILVATDSDDIAEEAFAALASFGTMVSRVHKGEDVRKAVSVLNPDVVILDSQIGNMGGVATSIDLRHEQKAGRLNPVKILMLLDRKVDQWIAEEAKVDAKLVKPLNAFQLRKITESLL
jgi:DNA-binding response OmpR family regulator